VFERTSHILSSATAIERSNNRDRAHIFQTVALKLLSTATVFSAYARLSISEFQPHSIRSIGTPT
jgi:hypothetical protein